ADHADDDGPEERGPEAGDVERQRQLASHPAGEPQQQAVHDQRHQAEREQVEDAADGLDDRLDDRVDHTEDQRDRQQREHLGYRAAGGQFDPGHDPRGDGEGGSRDDHPYQGTHPVILAYQRVAARHAAAGWCTRPGNSPHGGHFQELKVSTVNGTPCLSFEITSEHLALRSSLDTREELVPPLNMQARWLVAVCDAGDGKRRPSPSSGGVVAFSGPAVPGGFTYFCAGVPPGLAMARGRQMGCVWQSDYAPETSLGHARVAIRPAARHRKPPLWRRAAASVWPLLATATARCHPSPPPGRMARRVAPARGR